MGLVTGFVERDGERVYWESAGDEGAPPLVLCHGAGGNHAIWYRQVLAFAARYRVITWDHRGFGRSSAGGDATPHEAVRDLEAVLDELDVGPAHVVGQSMGGWTALGLALGREGAVRSLTLADTIGGIYTENIAAHFKAYREGGGLSPRDLPLHRHPALGHRLGDRDPAQAFLYRQIGGFAEPDLQAVGAGLAETAWSDEELARLTCPVLFVVGEEDPIFPPSLIVEAAARIPGSKVAEIPACGHSPYFESPDEWNRVVGSFLESVEG